MQLTFTRSKTVPRIFLALLFLFSFSFSLKAQRYVEMMEDERYNFFDVQREAQKYFDSVGTGKGTGYKQYKRWEYETSLEVDEYGNRMSREQVEFEIQSAKTRNQKRLKTAAGESVTWTEVGPQLKNPTSGWNPGVGRVSAIAVESVNQQLIYVGTPEGGLWKSTNGGNTWTPMFDQNNNMKIFSIALDPVNSNIVYVGTNGAGIYKSTNGGASWTTLSVTTSKIGKIIIDPTNTSIVLAATSGGIYRSTNAGSSWTRTATYSTEDIEFKPGSTSIMYATGSSCYRSTNNGVNWTQITNGITGTGRSLVAVTPANPNYVYIVQASGSLYGKTYRSTDSGVSFTVVNSGSSGNNNLFGYETNGSGTSGQASYDMALCVSPVNANEVHLAGIICWKSTNGGTNFTATTAWTWGNSVGYNHADVHVLEYVGANIYSGSDGGIYKSTDKADNWTDLSNGLGIRQFYRLGICKTNANVFSGGAQDNGTTAYVNGTWKDWLGGDGMESFVDHTNTQIMYGTTQNGGLYKSTNGGNTRTSVTKPESDGNWVTPFLMDPNVSTTLYVGYVQVYKSTNSGSSWTAISAFSGTTKANDIQVSPSNSNYIYVIRGSGIHVTRNGGSTWTSIANSPSGTPNSIAIHPTNPEIVALCTSTGKVYKSTNGGTSWTDYSGTLPGLTAYKVTFDNRASEEGMYVGLRVGVYYRDKTMSDWNPYIYNLPYAPVYDMEFHAQSGRIYAITHGRGLWWAPAYTGGPVNQSPTVSITAPSNGASFIAPANITINATASDPDGTISKVEFYRGTTKLGEDATSPFSFNWAGVTAGSYALTAKAIDNLGAVTTSTVVNITVANNSVPIVSITAPANNAVFTPPANITITANASDADGTISKVEFYNGATKLGEDLTSPYSFAWNSVAAGTYQLTAKAIDNLGAVGTSAIITVIVTNSTPPTVSITAPANNTTYFAPATIFITTSASDADGTVSKVEFYRGTTKLGEDLTSPYNYNWTGVTAGTYQLTARATDNVGLVVTSSMVTVIVKNNIAPTVSIVIPSNNASFSSPGKINITANASDSDGSIAKVEFYQGATKIGEATSSPYTFNWMNVATGTYQLTAKATDNIGTITTSSAITVNVGTGGCSAPAWNSSTIYLGDAGLGAGNGEVVSYNGRQYRAKWWTQNNIPSAGDPWLDLGVCLVSNVNPTVSIAAPANGATFTAPANINITANAADSDGSIAKIQFYRGSTLLGEDATSPYSFNWTNVAVGTYTLTAYAVDNKGAVGVSSAVTITVNAGTVTPSVTIAASQTSICSGTSVTFTATSTNGGTSPSYQWKVNGTNVGTNAATFTSSTLTNNASVTVVMTSNHTQASPITATSNAITITVAPSVTPSVTASANQTTICSGTSVTFTATPTNGGTTPAYQWRKNGTNINGATNASYSTSTIANNDVFTVVLTSNASCVSTSTATSNNVTMTVTGSVIPGITASANQTTICSGTSVTFTATPTNGGTTPAYQWRKNGTDISGATNASYSTSTIANNDVFTVVLTSNASCVSTSTATSNNVTMTVTGSVIPSITASANQTSICSGTSVTFTATPTNGGTTPAYQWRKNGTNISGATNASYSTSTIANNDVFTVVLTSNASCVSTSTATSNAITMTVTPSVTPSVTASANQTSICSGTSVTFTATPTNGGTTPAYQWRKNGTNISGATNASYSTSTIANNDVITVVLTSNAICASAGTATSNGVTMTVPATVTPSVSIAASQTTINAGTSVTFTATAVNEGTSPIYQWKVNDTNVGTNASTFITSTLANNDVVTLVLTSNASCITSSTATSNAITMTVIIPNQLPVVSITSPVNGVTFSSPAAFTIAADATDADGFVTKVEFYNGSTKIGEDLASPYTWSISNVAAGVYDLSAKVYDNTGVSVVSSIVSITVNAVTGTEDCSGIAEWNPNSIYVVDNLVKYQGFKYRAKWWTTGENPAAHSGQWDVWQKLGECISGTATSETPIIEIYPDRDTVVELNQNLVVDVKSISNGNIQEVFYILYKDNISVITMNSIAPDFSNIWSSNVPGDYMLQVVVKEQNGMLIYSDAKNVKVSQTTGILNSNAYTSVSIVPNPSNGRFYLNIPNGFKYERMKVELIDMLGHIVFETTIESSSQEIETSNIKAGVYTVKVSNQEKVFVGKLKMY